jgi:hypothetical protein
MVVNRFDLATGRSTRLATLPGEIVALSYDAPSQALLATTVRAGNGEVHVLQVAEGEAHETRVVTVPGLTAAAWLGGPKATTPVTPPVAPTLADVVVPDVVGMKENDALAALRALGFDPAVERGVEIGAGDVYRQVPAAGERAPAGYPVRLWTCAVNAFCVPDKPDAQFLGWRDTDLSAAPWKDLTGHTLGPTPEAALDAILAANRARVEVSEWHAGDVVQADEQHAVLEVRVRNLPDDSGEGVDTEVTLEHRNDGWVIASARGRVLCQPGRGGYPQEGCT